MEILQISNLLAFVVLCLVLSSNCDARDIKNSYASLVLSLTHARSISSTQRAGSGSGSGSAVLDMMEPLRGIRDGYIISLNLGTPPQIIQVYLDTGSDLTWVPCTNLTFDCIDCHYSKNVELTLHYSPSRSSSSSKDSCSSPFCADVHSSDNSFDPCTVAGCSLSTLIRSSCHRPCPSFAYTYGDGVVAGALARDVLRVHPTRSDSTREVSRFCFGCVGSTYKEPIGIAGFGRGALSLPSQLGFLRKGFSHCFLPFRFANSPNFSSPLVVGDLALLSKEHLQFTPMITSHVYPNYYYIGLEAIKVGNATVAQVPLTLREFDSFGNGGMIIDSGTTYTHLPEPFYAQVLTVLESIIAYPRVSDVEGRSGLDLCYRIPCPTNDILADDDLPEVSFRFLNNVDLKLPPGNAFYAMSAPQNSTVTKCLLFQRMEESDYGPAGVFGSFQQQNIEVVYDLENERIGFKETDCALYSASKIGFQETLA